MKENNAGKIGYQVFTPDALDIIGAGTTEANRKLKFWANGGAEFNADVYVGNDLSVNGRLDAGLTYYYGDYIISPSESSIRTLSCPAGFTVVTGGGGHRDFNSAARDVEVCYSGPDLSAPLTTWRLLLQNTNGSESRTARIYVICSRIK